MLTKYLHGATSQKTAFFIRTFSGYSSFQLDFSTVCLVIKIPKFIRLPYSNISRKTEKSSLTEMHFKCSIVGRRDAGMA
jgi:hypothetical protein